VQNRLSEVQSAILSPVELMKRFLGTGMAPAAEPESEVETLRKRVAELEGRLMKTSRKQSRARKKH